MKRFFYMLAAVFFLATPVSAQQRAPDRMVASPPVVACPMIAKLCPDGSSVSPQGPHCEFPPCPGGDGGQMRVAPPPGTTVCTMDAKKCPDGSWVSRTEPNCEFAPCPGEKRDSGGTNEDKHDNENNEDKGDDADGGASSGSSQAAEGDAPPPIYVTPDNSKPATDIRSGE